MHGEPEFFHLLLFFIDLLLFQVTGIEVLVFSFIDEFIAVGQVVEIGINSFIDKGRCPAFFFHGTEK